MAKQVHAVTTTDLGPAAADLFFSIAERLGLTVEQEATLLGVSERTAQRYQHEGRMPESRDTIERISHVATIWIDLTSLFREESGALAWLHAANERFNGASPLERMLAGNVSDLVDVRYDIEAILVA